MPCRTKFKPPVIFMLVIVSYVSTAFMQGLSPSDTQPCDEFTNLSSSEIQAAAYFDMAQQQPFDIAIVSLNCAVQLNPEYAEAYYILGRVHEVLGNYQMAIDSYTEAIALDYSPLNWPYVGRGMSNIELGRYRQALADYTRAIQLDSGFDVAWHGRGLAYFELGEVDKAIEDFDRAIALGDGQELATYYGDRGGAYASHGKYEQAVDDYTVALAYSPENPIILTSRGTAFYEIGWYEFAISDYTHAIDVNVEYAAAYYGRGLVFHRLDDIGQAIEDFSIAIEITPEDALVYVGRGNAYSDLGENELAIAEYNTAILLGVSDETQESLVFLSRSIIYIRLQEYEKAESDLIKALELNPDNADIYAHIGHLYDVQGDFFEALEQYNLYLQIAKDKADPVIVERIEALERLLTEEVS